MFLATFLICLREGLEATLIVGILAAFLKRSGKSPRGVLVGAGLAALVSIAVGVGLKLAAQSLPQAQQEALETVIGIIAVVFVTTMILWMNTNARAMKASLEGEASQKLSMGGERALVGMAFLAVLKEGFETAVFLLAVFNSAHESAALGIAGAVVGLVVAVGIGYLIYFGGSRFNLSLFFKVTGPFLILVAAGFVANCFRTAHEAGWVNIGQAQVLSFPFLSTDSVLGAVITGMFSIQPDPRLIEVVAYFAYLIPVMIVYLWPQRWSLGLGRRRLVKLGCAVACLAVAAVMFAATDRGEVYPGSQRLVAPNNEGVASVAIEGVSGDELSLAIEDASGQTSTVVLRRAGDPGDVEGMTLDKWQATVEVEPSADLPAELTLNDMLELNGGKKLPSGISKKRTPGPFEATWSQTSTYSAYTTSDYTATPLLLGADCTSKLIADVAGGGIDGVKTVNVSGGLDLGWNVEDAVDWGDAAQIGELKSAIQKSLLPVEEQKLYWAWIPAALVLVALGLGASAAWDTRKLALERAGGTEAQAAAA